MSDPNVFEQMLDMLDEESACLRLLLEKARQSRSADDMNSIEGTVMGMGVILQMFHNHARKLACTTPAKS